MSGSYKNDQPMHVFLTKAEFDQIRTRLDKLDRAVQMFLFWHLVLFSSVVVFAVVLNVLLWRLKQ